LMIGKHNRPFQASRIAQRGFRLAK